MSDAAPIVLTEQNRADIHRILDLLSSSLDWGSGFLDDEDVAAWNRVGEVVGYPAEAMKTEHAPGRPYSYVLRPLVRCESRLDTSEPGEDGQMVPLTLRCHLHEGHRGAHSSLEVPGGRCW